MAESFYLIEVWLTLEMPNCTAVILSSVGEGGSPQGCIPQASLYITKILKRVQLNITRQAVIYNMSQMPWDLTVSPWPVKVPSLSISHTTTPVKPIFFSRVIAKIEG